MIDWIELALICVGAFAAGLSLGWTLALGGVRRRRRTRPVETIDLSRR